MEQDEPAAVTIGALLTAIATVLDNSSDAKRYGLQVQDPHIADDGALLIDIGVVEQNSTTQSNYSVVAVAKDMQSQEISLLFVRSKPDGSFVGKPIQKTCSLTDVELMSYEAVDYLTHGVTPGYEEASRSREVRTVLRELMVLIGDASTEKNYTVYAHVSDKTDADTEAVTVFLHYLAEHFEHSQETIRYVYIITGAGLEEGELLVAFENMTHEDYIGREFVIADREFDDASPAATKIYPKTDTIRIVQDIYQWVDQAVVPT